jgi:hypothetical protein
MRGLADRLGAVLVVTAIPFGNQIAEGQVKIGAYESGLFPVSFQPRTQYPDLIRDYCRKNGIPYIDLLTAFRSRAVADGVRNYLEYDGHFNRAGNKAFAEVIADNLISYGILTKP